MSESLNQYPKFEKIPFDPYRERISSAEKGDVLSILRSIGPATAALYLERARLASGEEQKPTDLMQRVVKMWLRAIEASPSHLQAPLVRILSDKIMTACAGDKELGQSLVAGAMGELAGGRIISQSGLKLKYPESKEDLFEHADLIATLPDSQEAHIQTKTISLPPYFRRGNMPENRLPIFSCLETEHDLEIFLGTMDDLGKKVESDNHAAKRIIEIKASAIRMHQDSQKGHYVPIFSLWEKPGSFDDEAADISLVDGEVSDTAMGQALAEMDMIKRRYSR